MRKGGCFPRMPVFHSLAVINDNKFLKSFLKVFVMTLSKFLESQYKAPFLRNLTSVFCLCVSCEQGALMLASFHSSSDLAKCNHCKVQLLNM